VALSLALVAFVAAAQVSSRVFDRVPHVEDEVAFVFQARVIASGRLTAPAPARPEFFSAPFIIVRDGRWYGKYTPGYPAVLALGARVGRPWLVNPLAGALAVALLVVLGQRLFGLGVAALAGALLVASPFFLLQAGSLMSHVVSLCWTLGFLLLFESARRRRSEWRALAAGAAMGALFITRPMTAVGIGLPYAAWAVVDVARERGRLRAYALMLAGYLPFALLLLGWNQRTTGDPFKSAYQLWWSFDKIGFGDGIGIYGHHSVRDGWRYTRINLRSLRDYLYGWPGNLAFVPPVLAAAVAAGLQAGRLTRKLRRGPSLPGGERESWDLVLVATVASLILVHLAYPTPGQMYGPRYYFEALGPLALLSARGLLHVSAAVGSLARPLARDPARAPRVATALTLVFVVGLFVYGDTHFTRSEFGKFEDWNGVNGVALRQVEAAHLKHAVVFVAADGWTDYAPFFTHNNATLNGNVVYAIDRGARRDGELLRLYPGRGAWRYRDGQLTPLQTLGQRLARR
jgi:4-amino-4-deoxy-L-arabinose transferase-like glycosyltransferase